LPLPSLCRKTTTQRLLSHEEGSVEERPVERRSKFLPQVGWPTQHKTSFHQQELSQRPLRFRTLSRRPPGFRNRMCKLSQRPLRFRMLSRRQSEFRIHMRKLSRRSFKFRKLNRQPLILKTHKHLVTCNQSDRLNLLQSSRLGFRASELSTMIESSNVKKRQTATRYHRSLAGTSSCSRSLQLSKQSKESSTRPFTMTSVVKKRREQMSSTICSTGAHQHQSQQVQLSSDTYTSLCDKQDAPSSKVAADGYDYDRDSEQRSPVVKLDNQCELSSRVYASLIIGKHADESGFNRTIALLMQPETDEEHRYDDKYRLSARQSYVIVHSTWFDDAVQRECHLTNYESANQDSRQRPLSVNRQAISDQPTVLTSGDSYRCLLYPCRQCIWSQYSLAFDSAMFIANSSSAFRRKNWLQQLCSSPSVRSTPFHSFEVVDTSSVASMSLTTENSVGTRAPAEKSLAHQ